MAQRGEAAAAVVPAGDRYRLKHLLLDGARAAMLIGAAAAISTTTTVGNPGADPTLQAFVGLSIWLIGVCLLSLAPVADRRFPRAAALVGAATVANAVLKHCFALMWN